MKGTTQERKPAPPGRFDLAKVAVWTLTAVFTIVFWFVVAALLEML